MAFVVTRFQQFSNPRKTVEIQRVRFRHKDVFPTAVHSATGIQNDVATHARGVTVFGDLEPANDAGSVHALMMQPKLS